MVEFVMLPSVFLLLCSKAEREYEEGCLNKKECPVCGMKQSFDELVKKQKTCKGEHCGGALYALANKFDAAAFLARQREHAVKQV